jgi:hypothetical protein
MEPGNRRNRRGRGDAYCAENKQQFTIMVRKYHRYFWTGAAKIFKSCSIAGADVRSPARRRFPMPPPRSERRFLSNFIDLR